MNPARAGRLSLLAADSIDNLKEAKIVASPNIRFALENRKDLCDPAERARDVEHFDAMPRPLKPPCRHVWERVRRKGQSSDIDQWRCALCGHFKARV